MVQNSVPNAEKNYKEIKMKKKFLVYMACWAVMLALFNVIVFVTPNEIAGISKFTGGFWIGYGFSLAAFVGHLFCAWFAFKVSDNQKFFYNISLITISYFSLIISVIVSIIFMIIPQIPAWIAAIVCSIILAFSAIAVIKAKAAAETVAAIDQKIKEKTSFIRETTADASQIVLRSQTPEIKAEAKKVYEALRYSDPMSSPQLSAIESEISAKLNEFAEHVANNDEAKIKSVALILINLINERANKCKLLKKN